jgi:1-acyl-sn-glycerol-3-phosphate acyltransferase
MSADVALPTHRGAVVGRWLAARLMRALWSVRVHGAEHVPADGPVILAPNHSGFVDAPLLVGMAPRPIHTLAKKELFRGPVGWVLRGVGQIPLDRDEPGRSMLNAAVGVLDAGRVLVVFPEGTRGAGDFGQLRTGLAWFASRKSVPVVPVVFGGTGSRGSTLSALPRLRSRLEVVFGAPVRLPPAERRTRSSLADATERLRQALVAHWEAAAASQLEEPPA